MTVEFGEIAGLPPAEWDNVIVATGPLTSRPLAEAIQGLTGEAELAFFDAIAPIVHGESINMDIAWAQSRYDKAGPGGTGADYLNCPMDEAQYNRFVDALLTGEKHVYHQWENVPYFDGCLPVEVMAERGRDTLRWGPLKPVGLTNPRNPTVKPYAIVQLRQDNALGTLWNMVGFQTKLKYGRQAEIFRLIPGLENAQFARLGGLHHNTFLNSPKVLDRQLRLKAQPRLRVCRTDHRRRGLRRERRDRARRRPHGRRAERRGEVIEAPAATTALGALFDHILGGHIAAEGEPGPRSLPADERQFWAAAADVTVTKPEGHEGRWRGPDKAQAKKKAMSAQGAGGYRGLGLGSPQLPPA